MLRCVALILFGFSLLTAPVTGAETSFRSAAPVLAMMAKAGDLDGHQDIGPIAAPGLSPCLHLCSSGGMFGIAPNGSLALELAESASRVRYFPGNADFASRAPLSSPEINAPAGMAGLRRNCS